jgi:metal-responsive CopG/Arc/MetJ family transcriptional regulator
MPMKKIMVSMTQEMVDALEKERKKRKLSSIPEVVRQILSDYLSKERS